jgi:hypothetical protein
MSIDYSDTDVTAAVQWLEQFFTLEELEAASAQSPDRFVSAASQIVFSLSTIANHEEMLRGYYTQYIRSLVELGLKAKK